MVNALSIQTIMENSIFEWSRSEFFLRHFTFRGLNRENFLYFITCRVKYGTRKLYLAYRIFIACYWIIGWIYCMVISFPDDNLYIQYFANWTDTVLLIYFVLSAVIVAFEENCLTNNYIANTSSFLG